MHQSDLARKILEELDRRGVGDPTMPMCWEHTDRDPAWIALQDTLPDTQTVEECTNEEEVAPTPGVCPKCGFNGQLAPSDLSSASRAEIRKCGECKHWDGGDDDFGRLRCTRLNVSAHHYFPACYAFEAADDGGPHDRPHSRPPQQGDAI